MNSHIQILIIYPALFLSGSGYEVVRVELHTYVLEINDKFRHTVRLLPTEVHRSSSYTGGPMVRRSRYQPVSSKWASGTRADCYPGWESIFSVRLYPVQALVFKVQAWRPRWRLCMHVWMKCRNAQVRANMRIFATK